MKKIIVKNKVIDTPYAPATDELPEIQEVFHYEILDENSGEDEAIAQWLADNVHKYPEGYEVDHISLDAEIAFNKALESAKSEIAKGINALAIFKVRVKNKGLSTSQIGQLFASAEINKIISALSTGSLPLAAYLIASYQADGVIVSEEDKQAIIAALG